MLSLSSLLFFYVLVPYTSLVSLSPDLPHEIHDSLGNRKV